MTFTINRYSVTWLARLKLVDVHGHSTVRIIFGPVPKFDYILKEILQPHVGFRTVFIFLDISILLAFIDV